jgi:hypothetical protein
MLDRRAGWTGEQSWLEDCIIGPFGAPLPVLANVLTGLREELPGYFAFDEMLCAPMRLIGSDGRHKTCTSSDVAPIR